MSTEQKTTGGGAKSYVFSARKKLLCALATAILAGGFGIKAYDSFGPSSAPAQPAAKPGTAPAGSSTFFPGQAPTGQPTAGDSKGTQTAAPPAGEEPMWSPLLVKGGAGFLIGFCMGFFLRKFLRMSAAIAGLFFLGLFAAGYFGWFEVNWTTVQDQLNALGTRVGAEFQSFKAFIAGTLPAGALGALGLATGFKRQ